MLMKLGKILNNYYELNKYGVLVTWLMSLIKSGK